MLEGTIRDRCYTIGEGNGGEGFAVAEGHSFNGSDAMREGD